MSKITVKILMEQLFYKILHDDMSVGIYEPRTSKTGTKSLALIDKLYPWLCFSDLASEKQKARAHKYDTLEADWYINIPSSPADVSEISLCIYLKDRLTKPRVSPSKKEANTGEG